MPLHHFSRGLRYPPHVCTILLGVGGTIYNNQTLEPFKELDLDSQKAKKLASKLHVHSVNYAVKSVKTRHALSNTYINCHQKPVSGQACNPPDPHLSFFVFFGGFVQYPVSKWLKVKVYAGKQQRALRKSSRLVLTLARASPKIEKEKQKLATNEHPAGCQPCNPACA